MTTEINAEEELRRIKEDQLARNHCGYFKLWRMKHRDKDSGGWSCGPWVKDKVIGIFPTREPCEEFLTLIEHGPEATYEFVLFNKSIDHIKGGWDAQLDRNGDYPPNRLGGYHGRQVKWNWSGGSGRSYCHGPDRFTGYARTKEEAIAKAKAYIEAHEKFVREERPKRAKGCYCQPNSDKPCGPCEKAVIEQKKQDCGCPHCEGDH